jgi:hypothetical protein
MLAMHWHAASLCDYEGTSVYKWQHETLSGSVRQHRQRDNELHSGTVKRVCSDEDDGTEDDDCITPQISNAEDRLNAQEYRSITYQMSMQPDTQGTFQAVLPKEVDSLFSKT